MKIDTTKPVLTNLLALIKAKNPNFTMTESQVTFGTPTVYAPGTGNRNTSITVTAIKNKGFSGTRTIKYRRLTVQEMFPNMPTNWPVTPSDTSATVMARIQAQMGNVVGELLVNNGVALTLPTLANPSINVTVATKANSALGLPGSVMTMAMVYAPPVQEFTYTGSGNNLNTTTIMGNPTAVMNYRLILTGVIGSTSAANPALTVGTLPAGSILTIINRGTIQGCGGAGGPYTAAGGPGGDAIKALMPFTLDNTAGKVFGGGGGGGGCAQSWSGLIGLGSGYLRAAGGGGSGNAVGAAGTGSAVITVVGTTVQPAPGTATAGGAGAVVTNSGNTTQNSKGGKGGDPGEAGTTGVATYGTAGATTITNFAGGVAGKAINKNGFAVTISAGNTAALIKGAVA